MEVSPLANIDRLSSRSTFRGFTASPCGIIGTLMFLALTIYMNVWIVLSYAQGNYFQSGFETQATANSIFQVPNDMRMAIVFYNKTSGVEANHSLLATYFDTKIFSSSNLGANYYVENAVPCNGPNDNYFGDAINPVTLKDCYIFPPGRVFPYSYVPTASSSSSTLGFYFSYNCLNPFFCKSGGSTLTSVQSNLVAFFTNYSMVFYFSTRVLQPDGTNRHQVYNISSGQFTNPSAISAAFDSEVMMSNITMDYSIMPWKNMVYTTNLAFLGLQKGTPKTTTNIYSPLPKIDTIASNYQYLIFRYYKKEDWLLGVIGGSAYLIFLSLWVLCHPINQALFRMNAAQQLLLQVKHTNQERSLQVFHHPTIPQSYPFLRFLPFYSNRAIDAVTPCLDIANIIKQIKIAQRNLLHFGGKLESKYWRLKFENPLPPHRNQLMNEQVQGQPNVQGEYRQGMPLPQMNKQQTSQVQNLISPDKQNAEEKKSEKNKSIEQEIKPNMKIEIKDDPDFQFEKRQDEKFQFEGVQIEMVQKKEIEREGQKKIETVPIQQQVLSNKKEEEEAKFDNVELSEKNKGWKQKSSDDKVLSEHKSKSKQKNDEMIQELIKNNDSAAIVKEQDIIEEERNSEQISKEQAQLLGIHPETLKAIKNSENTAQLLQVYPTIMHVTNNMRLYDTVKDFEQYKSEDSPNHYKKTTRAELICNKLIYYLKFLDFYGVKIQFNAGSQNSSWIGVLFTLIIIALPCIQMANLLQLAGTYQVYVSKDFLQSNDINYALTTGQGFRPAVCVNQNTLSYMTGSSPTIQFLFYTYSASQGYTYYQPVNLQSNQNDFLGISPDSTYYNLDTSTCFTLPENLTVPMGGYNTPQEAYFGFRLTGYCSGTNAYCNSTLSTTNSNFLSFLNNGANTFTLYTPVNQYSSSLNSIYTGSVFAHNLREGTSNFATSQSVEETLYLDRIQLLDSYTAKFLGQPPRVMQETICTSRYQLGEITKSVNSSTAYYELRIRPSGNLTKVYLVGYTLVVILGLIGGVFFLSFAVFHCFGKIYNNYNVRLGLAEAMYNEDDREDAYYGSLLYRLLFLFLRPVLKILGVCSLKLKYETIHLQKVDEKIKEELNAIQLCKLAYTLSKLSTLKCSTIEQKQLAMVYLKERANPIPVQEVKKKDENAQELQEVNDEQLLSELSQARSGSHQVANEDNPPLLQLISSKDKLEMGGQQNQGKKDINWVWPDEPFKVKKDVQRSKVREFVSCFDWFHSDAEFSLNGEWRVRSIFGCLLSLLTVALILIIFLYYIISYANGMDRRVSYDRGMLVDPMNTPPIQLNETNFRLALGFYTKPSFAFQNVSAFINSSATSTIAISVYQDLLTWVNNTMVPVETKFDLVPCPSNYFDRFMSSNEDPTYFSSVINGFCIPYNVSLNLTSEILNNYQYFRVSVYNKTATASTLLQTLTSSYAFGLYMSVPVVNMQNNNYSYIVQQIRPNSEVLTKAYNVNITLTRQSIAFTTPNYTANQNGTTLSTYNYLEDRAYEVVNANSATTLARVYNVSFCHSGLYETYTVSYSTIAELFGYAGGISLIIICVIGWIAQNFNTYYKEFLIGKELYLLWPKAIIMRENNLKTEEKGERQHLLLGKRQMQNFQKYNQLNEFDVFKAWLLSFPATLSKSYHWNQTLNRVHLIRSKALVDLDLNNTKKKMTELKDTIDFNEEYRLSANKDIPLTSIYEKKIIINHQIQSNYETNGRFYSTVKAHQLSSKDQWKLLQFDQLQQRDKDVKLQNVFSNSYLKQVLVYKKGDFELKQTPVQPAIQMVRPQKSSSKSIKSIKSIKSKSRKKLRSEEALPADDPSMVMALDGNNAHQQFVQQHRQHSIKQSQSQIQQDISQYD